MLTLRTLISKQSLRLSLIILILALVISSSLMTLPVLNYNFPFTSDQGRDMIDIREIVVGKNLRLIGPTTSINGVFLGPFYYYFNVLPFIIGSGDPSYLVYWNILFYLLCGIIWWVLIYKKDQVLAILLSTLFLLSSANFYSARFFWSANPMPYLTSFYLLSLIYFLDKPTLKRSFWLGLISGLPFQFEAAFGVLFFPFAFLTSLLAKKGGKPSLYILLGFFVTLIPQILFEVKNKFVMTKVFLSEISGKSEVLGQKMTFIESLQSHFLSYLEFTNGILELPTNWTAIILVAAIIYLSIVTIKKKISPLSKSFFLISLSFILLSFLFYSWYLHPLKGWYLLGLRVFYTAILATFLTEIAKIALDKKNSYLPALLIASVIIFSAINTINIHMKFIPKNPDLYSSDKSNLKNEMSAIDWVYKHMSGKGFKAYNYIPSVYDYPYQYLYFWYGAKKYGYQPEDISYQEKIHEYIPGNKNYLTKSKPQEEDLIALIYEDDESPERKFAWGGNFTKYCPVTDIRFTWGTSAEIRKLCPEGTTNQNKLR